MLRSAASLPGLARSPAVLLALLVALAYAPSLANDFVYDDHEVVLAQSRATSLGELLHVFVEPHFHGLPFYRPVVRITLLGQKALHGDVAWLFHAANAGLAVAAALLAFALLQRPGFRIDRDPAWLAAALFAVHPVASSAVYPIASGRETLLPSLLSVLSVWAWLGGSVRSRILAVTAFAGALFGKEAAITVPGLFVLADLLRLAPDSPGLNLRRVGSRQLPVVCIALVYLGIRQLLFAGGEYRLALAEDPLGPLRSVLFALQSSVAPFWALAYEPETAVWRSAPRLGVAVLVAAALLFFTWRDEAPARRAGVFWLAWFLLALLPTANLLHQEAPFDERYVFLALLAPLALLAAQASRAGRSPLGRALVRGAGAALVVACLLFTLGRSASYRDDESFAKQWLVTNPRSAEAHHALGLVLVEGGRVLEGTAHYQQALAIDPEFVDARHNLATALAAEGRSGEARAEFEAVLRRAPDHPEANNNLGLLLAAEGRLAEAIEHYRRALAIAPRFAEAHNNLGTALARSGDLDSAASELDAALRLAPGYEDARRNLALVQAERARRQGDPRPEGPGPR